MRELTPAGIEAALEALNATIRDDRNLGDDCAVDQHLSNLELCGETEVDYYRTKSRRPEIVKADPAWFGN